LSRLQATSFGCPSLKPTSPPPSSSPLCLSESLQGGCVLCRPLALSSRTSFFFQTQHFLFLCLWCSLNTRLPVSTQCCMFLYPPGILSGWPSGPSASRFGSVLCDWLPPPSSAANRRPQSVQPTKRLYIRLHVAVSASFSITPPEFRIRPSPPFGGGPSPPSAELTDGFWLRCFIGKTITFPLPLAFP
jgi:hypothetical protein